MFGAGALASSAFGKEQPGKTKHMGGETSRFIMNQTRKPEKNRTATETLNSKPESLNPKLGAFGAGGMSSAVSAAPKPRPKK